MKNYYRILGVDIDAEHEEIKAAYRILAQRFHPDKGGEASEFRLIQEAYDILGNPLTKRNYDHDLFDYLRQNQQSNVTSVTQIVESSASWWLWFSLIFAIGAISFAGYAFYKNKEDKITIVQHIQPVASAPQATTIVKKKSTSPKKATAKQPTIVTPSVNTNPLNGLSGTHYLVNLGSFSSLTAAKNKQAELSNQGYRSKIQKIEANSEGLGSYNLFMGPYSNQLKAYDLQESMEAKNIEAKVERVDIDLPSEDN